MLIKVCGLTRIEDLMALPNIPVDLAGFIFAPGSKRCVQVEQVRNLIKNLPPKVLPVGVFRHQPVTEVEAIGKSLGLVWIQLHGGFTFAQGQTLKAAGFKIIWALPVSPEGQWLEQPWPEADYWLLDLSGAQGFGGTGQSFDWKSCARPQHPFFIAGGLNPENMSQAADHLSPDGLDFNSGLEIEPGQKDPNKFAQLKAALCKLPHSSKEKTHGPFA